MHNGNGYTFLTMAYPESGHPYPIYVGKNETMARDRMWFILQNIYAIKYVAIQVWHEGDCAGQLNTDTGEIIPLQENEY